MTPQIECTEIGTLAVVVDGVNWTPVPPSALESFTTGENCPASRRYTQFIARNDDAAVTFWLVGRDGLTDEAPAGVVGAIPIPPGQSITLPLYGAGVATLSVAGDGAGALFLVGYLYPGRG